MAFSFISDLWNKWNIRGFVVLSLSLQIFLILFAPLRKKTANPYIISLLWLAYLMADSVAAFAVGLISHNQGNSNTHVVEVDGALQAFWASFLLLHLGGPDTITAFSPEDSSLWRRHLLSLIFQVGAAVYVFVWIFPSDKSLVIPTILVFLAGFIKIAERTLALYLSSFPKLKESMLLDNDQRAASWSQLLGELNDVGDGYECSNEEREKLDESVVVNHAYSFFQIFKIFFVDLIYTKEQRKMSIDYFCKVSAMDALRLISVELNFIYEELHTKALTIRQKWICIFRIIAFTSIVVALGLFNHLKKYRLRKLDVKITYILLFGGIVIDGIALFILVFSDWTVAKIKHTTILYKLLSITDYLRKPRYITCEAEPTNPKEKVEPNTNVTYEVLDTPLIFRRWSESIYACNLFSEALNESPRKICKCNQFWGIVIFKNICKFPFRMVDKIIPYFLQVGNAKYVSKNLFMKKLWIFIFNDLKHDSKKWGDQAWLANIVNSNQFSPGSILNDSDTMRKANSHNYLIAWHIATEIWYNKDKQSMSSTITHDRNLVDRREFSKILSDYLMYLLLNVPANRESNLALVGGQMVAMKTLLKLREFISDATKDLNGLCEKLYNDVRDGMQPEDPTNPLKSPLKVGVRWARQLEGSGEKKWVEISETWLYNLQYTAINSDGERQALSLARGGELITFVWLLMAHRGCFYKPEWGKYREYLEEPIIERNGGDASVANNECSA